MQRVFISYHHSQDQGYKEQLLALNRVHSLFIDRSVDTGDIDDNLPDERIRQLIRDSYLRDSNVTIVLVGLETSKRKHVDWEIYSSMFDGAVNKRSGLLVVNLPTTNCSNFHVAHANEKETVYPDMMNWQTLRTRSEYESWYPLMPARIIDNLITEEAKVSVTGWNRIWSNPEALRFLIDAAAEDRATCSYDLSRPMKRRNS